jgi:hypothetical protein
VYNEKEFFKTQSTGTTGNQQMNKANNKADEDLFIFKARRIHKTGTILLAMALVFVLTGSLSACGTSGKAEVTDASSASSAAAEPEPAPAPAPDPEPAPEPKTTARYVIEIDTIKDNFVVMTHDFNDGASLEYQDKMHKEQGPVTDDDFLNNTYVPESQKLIETAQAFIDYKGVLNEECQPVQDMLAKAAADTIAALRGMEKGAVAHDLTAFADAFQSKNDASDEFTEAFDALQVLLEAVAAEWEYDADTNDKLLVLADGTELPVLLTEVTELGIRAIIQWDPSYLAVAVGDTIEADGTQTEVVAIGGANPETHTDISLASTAEFIWDSDEIFFSFYFKLW